MNSNYKTIIYPFLKIIICICFNTAVFFRKNWLKITNQTVSIIIDCALIAVCLINIYVVSISFIHLILIHERKAKKVVKKGEIDNQKWIECDKLLELIKKNDILDVRINTIEGIKNIGSASDNNLDSSFFFNKCYYIEEEIFDNYMLFSEKIIDWSIDQQICVLSIDGLPPQNINI